MNLEEFLTADKEQAAVDSVARQPEEDADTDIENSIDVQKAVVESLAADKAEQDEVIGTLRREKNELLSEIAVLKAKIAAQNDALAKVGDTLARNSETKLSTKVTIIERDVDVPDRFPGETRDHVLEVLKEARDRAEKEGRLRRAQILEGVLLANATEGTLEAKRTALEKFFADNGNILSGPVIERLQNLGISHKNGEDYLLPSEIIKRTY